MLNIIHAFSKNEKESLFNTVYRHFPCPFSMSVFIVYFPRLIQTRLLYSEIKIAKICSENQLL